MMLCRRRRARKWDQKVEHLFAAYRDAAELRAVAHKIRAYVDGGGHE